MTDKQPHVAAILARRNAEIDIFCDILSKNEKLKDAAKKVGRSRAWGENALRTVRDGLGWQAS